MAVPRADMKPEPPPIPQMLTLMPLETAAQAVEILGVRRGAIATLGLAGPSARTADLAGSLVDVGVERICPLGRMQSPPAAWRRDGRTTLGDLVRWADREEPS